MDTRISLWGVYSVWYQLARAYRHTLLINCVAPLTEPILYLATFGFGLSAILTDFQYGGQPVSYLQFLAPAMVAVGVLVQAFVEGSYGTFVRLRYDRWWHLLLTAPLTFSDIFLGSLFWGATKGMISGIATGLVAVLLGVYPLDVLLISIPILLGSLVFSALGMICGGLVTRTDQLNLPLFFVLLPMFAASGTYFPREGMPVWIGIVAQVMPMSWLVDLLRWHLALPQSWILEAVMLGGSFVVLAYFARMVLYRRIFGGA